MNAYELADKLEKPMLDNPDCPNFSRTRKFMEEIVVVLRQQADRIAELQKLVEEMKYEKSSGVYDHPVKQLSDEEIIEKLAELEHRQWMMWATNIVSTEEISKERKDRWFTCMVAYSELSEEMKEHDRVWARQALAIIKEITE